MLGAGLPGTREATPANGTLRFRPYVAGRTPKGLTALENLKKICEKHLKGQCALEVIDLMANPQLAVQDRIVAVPTPVPGFATPMKRIIGDLSNTEKVLAGLGLRSVT